MYRVAYQFQLNELLHYFWKLLSSNIQNNILSNCCYVYDEFLKGDFSYCKVIRPYVHFSWYHVYYYYEHGDSIHVLLALLLFAEEDFNKIREYLQEKVVKKELWNKWNYDSCVKEVDRFLREYDDGA